MSRSLLRRVHRLVADAAPIIAEVERHRRDGLLFLAIDHLLRVVAVFRYGEPKIDEPLALAYQRALSKLAGGQASLTRSMTFPETELLDTAVRSKGPSPMEDAAFMSLEATLEVERRDGDIISQFGALIQEIPDWLYCFCRVYVSAGLLAIELPRGSSTAFELRPSRADADVWPFLPQGVLEPKTPRSNVDNLLALMSPVEQRAYCLISQKPERELTRHEQRFVSEMSQRAWAANRARSESCPSAPSPAPVGSTSDRS